MLLDAEAAASVVLNAAAMLDRWDAGSAEDRALFRIVTPLAKYWITPRARVVAGEAMNVRGGNGYIEEWVNARLLRDAYLGAIWEGSTNVVALDVQRAILRDGGLEALAAFVAERLGRVTEPAAKPWVRRGRRHSRGGAPPGRGLGRAGRGRAGARRAAGRRRALPPAGRLAAAGRGPGSCASRRELRKLLVAALYLQRWLGPRRRRAPPFTARQIDWLDALADWRPVPLPRSPTSTEPHRRLRSHLATHPRAHARARLSHFMRAARHRHAGGSPAPERGGPRVVLGRRLEATWASAGSSPTRRVLDTRAGIAVAALVRGRLMNLSDNCVDRHVGTGRGEQPPSIWEAEDGAVRTWTYRGAARDVNRLANVLKRLGVGRGTRSGSSCPCAPRRPSRTLAICRIGAIYSPSFSGYGAQAVAARLEDCDAKVLITADGFPRRGQTVR